MGRNNWVRGTVSTLILFSQVSDARGCKSHVRVTCSSFLVLAVVAGLGARAVPVFIVVVVASALAYFFARSRRRPASASAGDAMAEAVQRERRMYLVNQARLDVEHWMQELEREARRREEEEELVPPPYSRQPKLPTWGELPDLQAQGEEEERGARRQSAERRDTNGPLSNSEDAPRKQNARIRFPPPSYSPC